MKKYILLLSVIAFFGLTTNGIAQVTGTDSDLSDFEKLDLLCSCMNKFMNDLHPRTRVMVRDIAQVGPQEAENKLTQFLVDNPDDMEQIMKDGDALQNFNIVVEKYNGCENLNAIINSTRNSEGSYSEEEIEAHLNSKVECEYAAIFFNLGQQTEETEVEKN